MENEELDNELVVSDDVPETSEQTLEDVQVSASENEEQIQDTTQEVVTPNQEDIDAKIEARANELMEEKIKDRLARDRASQERKFSKELSKYKHLESIMKAGLGVETLDETINKSSEFYKGQGVSIPEYKDSYDERREERLAKIEAQDIIELGKEAMEEEATKLSTIPYEKRTTYEKAMFNELCKELYNLRDIETLKAKGYGTELLNEKKFIDFRKQFNVNTPIESIVGMYKQINKVNVEKPASAGSAKSESRPTDETFSAERINNMKPQEMMKYWNNPAFRKAAGLN
ncbi:MAG: hypothetical protein IKL68_02150 [Clostridia bacterium]|nr:hypothetical protein [Clostridia bacterium]